MSNNNRIKDSDRDLAAELLAAVKEIKNGGGNWKAAVSCGSEINHHRSKATWSIDRNVCCSI